MADVARRAEVSVTTVSFVVNDRGASSISPGTRRRVLDAVEALDYRPNRAARILRAGRSGTIGFVTDEIAVEPFAGATILGAHEAAWEHDSLLLVVNTTRDRAMLRDAIVELVSRAVDAVVLAVVGTRRLAVPDVLKDVPAVLLNGYVPGGWLPSVLPDEVAGGRAAAAMLLGAGHRRIAYLTGPAGLWPTRARLRGFREAVAGAGADPADQVVVRGNFRVDSGYELTRALLGGRGPRPTAILCGNDRMALGAYLALAARGLRVPEDVSVVGYDDQVGLASDVRPALSTVRLPYYQMGRWASLAAVTGGIGALPPRTYLPCPPISRASVLPPGATSRSTGPAD
jgi:LacI family transcriptional regulator